MILDFNSAIRLDYEHILLHSSVLSAAVPLTP